MIQQHFLQQQRLNNNLDRLLERQNRLLTPKTSEFRPFGTSSLPGRNYEQYLDSIHGKQHRRTSLVEHSRASIGSSGETYRFMGGGASEMLPGNINSVMQHSRHHSMPLVHAEKFEPVHVYEHPVFGPTPAYLRPVYNRRQPLEDNFSDQDDSESEEDNDVRSHTSANMSLRTEHREQTKTPTTTEKNNNHDDDEYAPPGYISYLKWKEKYESVIPVNPLLYNIYTHRPNGSVRSYVQSLYVSPNRHRQLSGDDDLLTTTLSDIGSDSSDIPHGTSSSPHRRYHRLQPSLPSKTPIRRPLSPIHTANHTDSSDDESSPPDSPVPYLSRNKPYPVASKPLPTTTIPSRPFPTTTIPSKPFPTTTIPSRPIIPPSGPATVTLPTLNTSASRTTETSSLPPLASTNTSTIPPAPPLPSTNTSSIPPAPPLPSTNTSTIPPAPPLPSTNTSSIPPAPPLPSTNTSTIPLAPPMPPSLVTTSSNIPPAPPMPSSLATTSSNIPPAPPMPPSLATTSLTTPRTTFPSLPISSPPIAPPMPTSLTTSSSTTTYQAPSNISVPPPSASSLSGSTTKAVTFGGLSSIPGTHNNDVSSSSDSDDSEKQKRRRRKKRQAEAGASANIDLSSSDD